MLFEQIKLVDFCKGVRNMRRNIYIYIRRFIQNNRRKQITELDNLPMWDRGLIDYKKYHQFVGQSGIRYEMTMQGTRGCPFKCFYCDVQHITPFHRRRSPENIFNEVKYLRSLGAKRMEFIDDAFNVKKEDFKAFFRLVIQNKLDCSFYFQSGLRGDMLDEESIDLMLEAGVKSVNLSLESASPRLQKLMKKKLNIDKLYDNIQYIVKNYPQLIIGLNAMHGFPTETEEEALQTLNFIKEIKWLHFAQLHNVRIFPGSLLEQIALENGVTPQQIEESLTIPYHEMPTTIHFNPNFSRKLRLDFTRNYIFNPERMKYVLNQQVKVCNEDELLYKYKTIFPTHINSLDDILRLARLKRSDIDFSNMPAEQENMIDYPAPKPLKKMRKEGVSPLKILLIDASQFFTKDVTNEINAVEPPLGYLAILTYLNEKFGDQIEGKIYKSGVDFDSMEELHSIVKDFNPDLIGIRTMSYFKNFFADVIKEIRNIGCSAPIIAGGPHPTITPETCLRENDIQACVIGEGEFTAEEIVSKMLANNNKFLTTEELYQIEGIAFLD